jgi:L-xylulokinase
MPKYLLGTDNGGTLAKAAIFATDGRLVAVASRKTEMLAPRPGHTERRMDEMWQATAQAIREVLERARIDPREVAAVASAGHGNGLYLVDKQGNAVRDGIISTDARAKDYVARWYADGVHQQVLPKTMQSLWPGQPNALLAWLRDHEPESIERAGWALMCKDYVRFRLTGEVQSEMTDASGTSLMDVAAGQYDVDLLKAFGLAELRSLLPPVVRSDEICGIVTAGAAAETGLAPGTPVAGGMFDIVACAIGSGILDPSQLCLIAGTWSINQYVSTTPVVERDHFMTCRYCLPDYYLVPEASPTSASNLEWFVTQFFGAEQEAAKAQGRSVYDVCNDLVATTGPRDASVVFLPFLFGSNAAPDAKACFLGLGGWHTRAHVLRAIYEGVVFGHRAHVDRLLRYRGPFESIRLTGGAARSRPWVQIFADCFQAPVEVPAGSELGALGAAICAGVAAGVFGDYREAVEAMVKIDRVQQPDPANRDMYAEKVARYQKALEALGPLWRELA